MKRRAAAWDSAGVIVRSQTRVGGSPPKIAQRFSAGVTMLPRPKSRAAGRQNFFRRRLSGSNRIRRHPIPALKHWAIFKEAFRNPISNLSFERGRQIAQISADPRSVLYKKVPSRESYGL